MRSKPSDRHNGLLFNIDSSWSRHSFTEVDNDELIFLPSDFSLGTFCARRHKELGGSLKMYEVKRKWVVFEFCHMKCEMGRRCLFLPFQAEWLLGEEVKLREGIKDITVGRYVRRYDKRRG